ncbi:hypothetical protein ACMGE9_12615 [Macrococcus sp. EM39E]|uniref:hypothetical protein n=1 Tax=Macrococcus animalis TaxID=3395467 RepID=UPI0039BEA514
MMIYDDRLVKQMTRIHEYKGKQTIYLQYNTKALEKMKFAGLYHNIKYACALSGIIIADTKLMQLLQFRKSFDNEAESQISGFRDAMLYVSEDYEFIDINVESIISLFLEMTLGDVDTINAMSEEDRAALEKLCRYYNDKMNKLETNELIEIFHIIYVFIQSKVFNEKTMLFSRLLLHLLLFKSDILVTQYQSIDQLVFQSMSNGKSKLRKKQIDAFNFEEESIYFTYYFDKLIESYEALDFNFKLILNDNITPTYRILNVLNRSFEPISRSALEIMLADISRKTIERALVQLQKEAFIEKVGQGKSTKYRVI